MSNCFRQKMFPENACLFSDFRVYCKGCDRWGVCGALYLQSAIAEPNAFLGVAHGRLHAVRNVDNKVSCNARPRTVSG